MKNLRRLLLCVQLTVLSGTGWAQSEAVPAFKDVDSMEARVQGCHKIQLLTHKRHALDGAHDFYRSVGFEAEAEGFRLYLNPH